jgi:hypothetical protein
MTIMKGSPSHASSRSSQPPGLSPSTIRLAVRAEVRRLPGHRVRQDPYANEHRIKVKEAKPAAEQKVVARR